MESLPRRIVLTGSESTGKTTLARELARHFGAPWVPEYAREYALRKGRPLEASDVEPIARGQIAAENEAAPEAARLLVLDTDLLSTAVYAGHYYGACPPWILDAVPARQADLYLLCDIDVPWVPDPARDRPRERERLQGLFRTALLARGFPFVDLRGDRGARFARARAAVDAVLATRPTSG